jgi:hypothetical protein
MAVMPEGQEPREEMTSRFTISHDSLASAGQKELHRDLRAAFVNMARTINETVADSREKSLAITHLEEALMWTGKAIYKQD